MGGPRTSPKQQAQNRQALRQSIPVDYSGMDPEMASTLKQEGARKLKVEAATAPGNLLLKVGPRPKTRKKLGILGF